MQAQFGEELGRLHEMVENLSRQGHIDHLLPDLPAPLVPTYAQLIEADVPEVLCRRLVQFVSDELEPDELAQPDSIRAALCEAVEQCISVAPPIRPVTGTRRIMALVGPTGVGKTTTVAKLAANLKLTQGARVGLITVDTYRIAAVEQLKTYAEIIDLPLAVVNDPAEMPRALEELGAVDVVFIDTAGRSPRDEVKIRELSEFLQQARPDEVYLVLSAVAGPAKPAVGARAIFDRPGGPADPDQARRSREPGRRAGGAGALEPAGELSDHGPGGPRRHRAGGPQAPGTADPQTGEPGLNTRRRDV